MDHSTVSAPDPVEAIDSVLDSVLKRPAMFGVLSPTSLEGVVFVLLGLRGQWAPLPDSTRPRSIYSRWIKEYFDDPTPSNLCASARLADKFGGSPEQPYGGNEEAWPKIVEFYVEFVRRERQAARAQQEGSV